MSLPGSGIPLFRMKLAETGQIRDVKKIIAHVTGLNSCLNGQLVDFGEGVRGIVMGFDNEDVLVLSLGDESKLRMGKSVTGISEPYTIPVGDNCLGRMINALGEPVDGKKAILTEERRPVLRDSPTITDRAPVDKFLSTGTKVVDMFVPLGKGQRQLIIGDRITGKTVIAIDAIVNQKGKNVVCIYCCVGKAMSALEKAVSILHESGALAHTIIMVAMDNEPAGEQYLLPYAAASMEDYFAEKGMDVLVVFDDLTKHAWAYRQLSLLLERPPGREAYPGDIFYVHTQLMERAGRYCEKKGGGSMTFLGIAETLEGDLTGYIPSNLISMCDGLIFLSKQLFDGGIRPAVDFNLSVSIVGGRTQPPVLRAVSSDLRVQCAHYLEVSKLSKLHATVSAEAERVIKRGEAIMSIVQQPQCEPASVVDEVVLAFAVHRGRLDDLSTGQKKAFCRDISGFIRMKKPELLDMIGEESKLTSELEQKLNALLDAYFAQAERAGRVQQESK